MSRLLTVSIVLYKTPAIHLRQCIESLSYFSNSFHLYLVDNSPTDKLRSQCPVSLSHEYIHLPSNPGFGAGHNIAIKRAQIIGSKYHLVINADVSFKEDVLTPMLAYLERHPEVGQMMPRVENEDGSIQPLCKLIPRPSDLFLRRFSSRKTRRERNHRFELHDSGYNKIMFTPYLSGCFMLLRQSALKDVGLFDERFFMYPEDIDLTRRMAEHCETIFFPEVSVVHKHGAASRKSIRMLCVHIFNLWKYFNKWGWINDPVRDQLNNKALRQLGLK